MKNLILVLTVLLSQICSYAQQATTSTTYQLDVKQSKLFWKGTKTVGSKHFGFMLFNSGWLHTNVAGKLNDGMFSLNMNSITSTEHKKPADNQKIEVELKGSAFFEVEKYPTASIVVRSIMPTAKPFQFKVEGNLTIKNTTHPIVFLAIIKQSGTALNASANLTIDRKKWGIHETSKVSVTDQFFSSIKDKMVGDEIPIVLSLVFVKKLSEKL